MNKILNEFLFLLKPSKYGVGVFCTKPIPKDSLLPLFFIGDGQFDTSNIRDFDCVDDKFKNFGILHVEDKKILCPQFFNRMSIGWYCNHHPSPNTYLKNKNYYASRYIKADEEIYLDYKWFEEPYREHFIN